MIAAPIQVWHAITLELQPVDDEWQRFRFLASLLCRLFGQVGCYP
jgi:hypothetical protein